MKTKSMLFLVCSGLLALMGARPTYAADNSMEALQKRFEARYAQLLKLKSAGVIGETYKGYVDFVKAKSDDAKEIVQQENDDRTELYKLIAKKEDITPQTVAERNAKRNFQKAAPGEFLMESDGKWRKKA